jgi:hypothetical protein
MYTSEEEPWSAVAEPWKSHEVSAVCSTPEALECNKGLADAFVLKACPRIFGGRHWSRDRKIGKTKAGYREETKTRNL